jgi:hypothetical protein
MGDGRERRILGLCCNGRLDAIMDEEALRRPPSTAVLRQKRNASRTSSKVGCGLQLYRTGDGAWFAATIPVRGHLQLPKLFQIVSFYGFPPNKISVLG